ncbi:MAG: death-on-curing protein [Spirochaetaceae bacterium 4572_59]|nr:MAG: death-on-curing protein [Spirochaetaceae bacterium 4572_59]
MSHTVYITIENALEVYHKTIAVSGGGSDGVMDLGRLESVLTHIQNDLYYPEFVDKLTHLFFCANKFHCFEDGNKRIAISLGAQFLLLNGYVFIVSRFIREMENISYHLAAGKIEKDLLRDIIQAVLDDNMDNEEIKLSIFEAISREE